MSFKEWQEVKLGDVIDFNPRESIAKKQVAKKIAMEKLKPFTKFINDYEVAEFNGGTKFKNGDTLLARITPCLENGKTSQVTILDENEVGFGSTEYIVLREKIGVTNKDFIYYLSVSPKFRDVAIKSMVGSSGRQRVQQDELESLSIMLPPLLEQEVIAATLSCLDNKIENNNRINKNLEEMAQAIFKSWFIDFEPFQDGEFEDSEIGKIPKGWRIGFLGDLVDITRGASPRPIQEYVVNGVYPWVKIADATSSNTFFIADTKEKIIEAGIEKSVKVFKGDLILSNSATCGLPYIMGIDGCIHDGWLLFRNFRISKWYIFWILRNALQNLKGMATGTVQDNLNTAILKNLRVLIPSDEFLDQYNVLFDSLANIIYKNTSENQCLTTIRDSLLPKLMSGEIRVPVKGVS